MRLSRDRAVELFRSYLPLLLMGLVVLAARSSLADHYIVPSSSMEPTLVPGDRVFVDKTAYGVRVPFTGFVLGGDRSALRGEVVIFDSPADGTRLIKRVVAVAGDVVDLVDGHLSINGQPLAVDGDGLLEGFGERHARLDLRRGGGPDLTATQVPAGHVLVLGDFRGNSKDSRYFGFVAERSLYAQALGIYYRSEDGVVWKPL